jgi:DNA-damage-inducible protein J
MAETAMIHVRVEEDLKIRATEALSRMGMTVSEAVRVLLVRVASDQAFPFPIKVPNAATRTAMRSHDLVGPFATGEDLISDLDANAGR